MRWQMKLLAVGVVVCTPTNVGWGQTPSPQLNKRSSISIGESCVEPEWFERGQFEDESGIPLAKYGEKIVIDQKNAIVLAQFHRTSSETRHGGFAFIYKRLSESFKLVQTITAPTNTILTYIAMEIDLLALGVAFNFEENEESNGVLYFYRADADRSNWTFEGKLLAPDHPDVRGFGQSIAFSDSRMVVGTNFRGHAIVIYEWQGDAWEVEAIFTISPDELDTAAPQSFGDEVAICGDVVVTATPSILGPAGFPSIPSYVFIYRRTDGAWALDSKIEYGLVYMNLDLHLQVDSLVVKWSNRPLEVLKYVDGVWVLNQEINPPVGYSFYNLTNSDLFGDRLAIGGIEGYSSADLQVVFLYERDVNTDVWSHRTTIRANVNSQVERFGRSMALTENALAVGSQGIVSQVPWGGRVFIFDRLPPLDCDANDLADHCEIDQDWMKDLNFNRWL
ncbi:MAG: hypothetical protein O7G85_14080, partial [Planctomycetota bacterium]|nr:hypothetical protein [Planctomycetota bacterium]